MFLNSYPSGNTYSGEWKCNSRHGEGTMKWLKLGQQYVGSWHEGLQVRQTDLLLVIFCRYYHGDFLHGQRHGYGVFYYAGGAIYEGEWKNNKKNGQVCTFTLKFCFWSVHENNERLPREKVEKKNPQSP
uniref:MORN repeat containing 3 n=1 Tax=Oryzias melastigma TaxID=30732 RepID=A0A3B3D5Z0_ORYME